MQMLLNSANPMEYIQQMVMKNPNMQQIMQVFQGSGMTPKQFFYQFAQQKGIDPDSFLKQLNSTN